MSTINEIIGKDLAQVLKDSVKSNLEKLFPGKQFKDNDFIWATSFSGLTHIEVGLRLTMKVAEELELDTKDVREWPDGRSYLAVPLPIDQDGQISIPVALAKRDDWFILVKVVTRTATGKKGTFYTCCLSKDGKGLYKVDTNHNDGKRTHSIAYYKVYGQMMTCTPDTEENQVLIRPMNLIHLMRDKDSSKRIQVVIQKMMVLRRKDQKAGWQYKLSLTLSAQFAVTEKDSEDEHGIRIMPGDVRQALTDAGGLDWMLTAVRDTYRVLCGETTLPVFADQFDPKVIDLFTAIFGNLAELEQ